MLEIIVEEPLKTIICKALKPEVEEEKWDTKVTMTSEGERLIIKFNAKSLGKLRAILNSYLRWIKSVCEVLGGV